MAPTKQPTNTKTQDVAYGELLMTDFFENKKQRGRPKKRGNLEDDNIIFLAVKKSNIGRLSSQTANSLQTAKPPPRNSKAFVVKHPPPTTI